MTAVRAHVTDHALVRFLERVEGIDIERVRRRIQDEVQRGVEMDAAGVRRDGVRYTLVDGSVVTVTRVGRSDPRTGGHRGRRGDRDG
ncbi:MAG: hypothetical protein ACU0BF_09170 [Paracoccaceae bacterium]